MQTDQIDQTAMLHPEQRRIYQDMTAEQKLRIAADLYHFARELKAAGLRAEHPNWSEKKIQEEVREIFLYART
jgi:ABC-type Na+ transport system ATPase subunit NatA